MTLTYPCRCLSVLDRRDGRRCEHDNWGTRRPSPEQHWASPQRDLPLPLVLLVSAIAGVLLTALLLLGQTAMCAAHDQSLTYCPGYQPATSEETPDR